MLLKPGEKAAARKIDSKVKNKWSCKWEEEVIKYSFSDVGVVEYVLKDCISKEDKPGLARCIWCDVPLAYGNNGKCVILRHLNVKKHLEHVKTKATNYTLGSSFKVTGSDSKKEPVKTFSIFSQLLKKKETSTISKEKETPASNPKPLNELIPIGDRTSNMEALILAFMSEHSLPLSKTDSVVGLIKECSRDPQALSGVSLSKTPSTYKMQHGLGKTLTDELVVNLKSKPFSLTADESTTIHGKRVLTILVSFISDAGTQCVEHLASVELAKVDAENISKSIIAVFEDNEIPWINLVSVLFDSCNVMRGIRNGVEVKLKNKAPHLVDIDGDSCHHVHNVVKEFCRPFDNWLEGLFNDLYADFKYCSQFKELISELARLGGVRFTVPQRFVSHRWLSAYDRAMDTARLLDVYLMFYFAFVPVHEEGLYRGLFEELLQKLPSAKARQHARSILITLRGKSKSMTTEGKEKQNHSQTVYFSKKDNSIASCLHECITNFQRICSELSKEGMSGS